MYSKDLTTSNKTIVELIYTKWTGVVLGFGYKLC